MTFSHPLLLLHSTHSMLLPYRYGVGTCTVTQCQESSTVADVRCGEGDFTHLNLYTCKKVDPEQAGEVQRRFDNGNLLLHAAVKEVLTLTRPLSFG